MKYNEVKWAGAPVMGDPNGKLLSSQLEALNLGRKFMK